jgi:hypothetical protein
MENDKNFSAWQKDYEEFSSASGEAVPVAMSAAISERVRSDLNPSAFRVFGKTAVIHSFVGAATLLFCPQFGVSFTSGMGLMPYLMKYGESVCMLGCGALFTAVSLMVASLVLRPEEVRALKENEILQLATLSTLSLGAISFLGGEIALTLGFVWLLGAILGGALSLEAGWVFRKVTTRRAV